MATRGPKPGTENARHGGQAVAAKYGDQYYRRIGKLGGTALAATLGAEHFARIGKIGGETTRDRHPGHYAAIGRRGGKSPHPARDRSVP